MKLRLNRTAVAVVAGLAIAGGGGAALAASQADDGREAILNGAAERLGVEPAALEDALQQAAIAQVDAAVKAGSLSEAQGEAVKARIEAGKGPLLGGFGHHRGHRGLMKSRAVHEAAATYLGVTADELRAERQAGKSLADVATEKAKSVEGLKQAMLAAAKSELDADTTLTDAEKAEKLDRLEAKIDDIVERAGGRGFGGRHFGGAFGFGVGPGSGKPAPADPASSEDTA